MVADALGIDVSASDLIAYFAAVAAHPAYTERFQSDLVLPGLRFPLTAHTSLFREAVDIGREVIWLHCFGERFADVDEGRPNSPPRMPEGQRPIVPREGSIPTNSEQLPRSHRVRRRIVPPEHRRRLHKRRAASRMGV